MTDPLGALLHRHRGWRAWSDAVGSPHRRLACWLLGAHLPWDGCVPAYCCNCHRHIRQEGR